MQSGTVYLKDQERFHKVTCKVTFQHLPVLTATLAHYSWHMLVINKYFSNVIEHSCHSPQRLSVAQLGTKWNPSSSANHSRPSMTRPFLFCSLSGLTPPNPSQWAPSLQSSSNPDHSTHPGCTCVQTKRRRKRDEGGCLRWGQLQGVRREISGIC